MKIISTGDKSTLATYYKLSLFFFGPESVATKYIQKKITESPNGEDEEVIMSEQEVMNLLGSLHAPPTYEGHRENETKP